MSNRARFVSLAVLVAALYPTVVRAADSWSTPFPGVRRLVRTTATPWRINVLYVDLCAPGVSVRATTSAEKGRVPSSFGTLVGAEAAVNGDFFGADFATTGLAIGEGMRWRNDTGGQGFIAFGDNQSDISVPSELVASPPKWMRQAVGGRPALVIEGVATTSTGTICPRNPRTAVGLTRDRRTLIVAVVDGRSTISAGMTCAELAVLMRDLGAYDALNLDGGGSSAMWLKGIGVVNAPSDGTQRVVANHLAIQANGTGIPAQCPIPRDEVLYLGGVVGSATTSDVDGDGMHDACGRTATGITCSLSSGTALANPISGPSLTDASGWADEANYSTIRMGDIDGDQRADICARADAGVRCWLSTGTEFGAAIDGPALSDAAGWASLSRYGTIQLADVTGDGKDDLCARDSDRFRCYPSTGSGFGPPVDGPALSDATGWNRIMYYGTIRMGDVDGDGRADVCARAAAGMRCWLSDGTGFPTEVTGPAWSDSAGWNWVQYWSTIRLADINGDGRADLCGRSADGFRCHPSEGITFGEAIVGPPLSNASGWGDYANYSTIRMADIDGDSRDDICARANAGVVCWRSTGTAFSAPLEGPQLSDARSWNLERFHRTLRLADVNGDAAADICARSSTAFSCWLWNGSSFDAQAIDGPAWSDASGWSRERQYGTIRAGGPFCRAKLEVCNGVDDNCDGAVDEGCPDGSGGGDGGDGTSGDDGAPGGCTVSREAALPWLAALWLVAGRRRNRGTRPFRQRLDHFVVQNR